MIDIVLLVSENMDLFPHTDKYTQAENMDLFPYTDKFSQAENVDLFPHTDQFSQDYKDLEYIGKGRFGTVFKVESRLTGIMEIFC